MDHEEPDFLDEMTVALSGVDRSEVEEWERTKRVVHTAKLRRERGLSEPQVAAYMGVPPQTVAEIEREPRSASPDRIDAYTGAVEAASSVLPLRRSGGCHGCRRMARATVTRALRLTEQGNAKRVAAGDRTGVCRSVLMCQYSGCSGATGRWSYE